MELSRRQVLSLVPAAGLLAMARPGVSSAEPATGLDRLLANTVTIFAGTPESNARPEVPARSPRSSGPQRPTSRPWTTPPRVAEPTDEVVLTGARRDGRAWAGAGTADLAWLRYANHTEHTSVGYVFLGRQRVTVDHAPVTRSRRVVRTSNPDTPVTKNVFGVTVEPRADALAYALVPNASGQPRTRARVLANDRRMQAITHPDLCLTAANTFRDGWHHAGRLRVQGPASVLLREKKREVTLAVSDPTMTRDEVSVVILGPPLRVVTYDEGITVRRVRGGTLVRATTRQAHGRTFTVTLR